MDQDRPETAALTPRAAQIHQNATNVKETLESILVAFILAFIFRAFVVEAFVIPTGSMAPTLMGAHFSFVCPDCGYPFAVNFDHQGDDDIPDYPEKAKPIYLPVYCP